MTTCSILDCEQPAEARGWCYTHYRRWLRHGDPTTLLRHPVGSVDCSVDGCEQPVIARGWCGTHYARWRKHGDPAIVLQRGRKPQGLSR